MTDALATVLRVLFLKMNFFTQRATEAFRFLNSTPFIHETRTLNRKLRVFWWQQREKIEKGHDISHTMVIIFEILHPGNGMTIGSGVTACAPDTAILDRVDVPSNDLSSAEQTSAMSLDNLDIVTHGAKLVSSLF